MWFVKLLRALFGTVGFEAKEGFLDRFVNLCWSAQVPLWDVRRVGDALFACTGRLSFLRAKKCAERSGTVLRVLDRSGLPYLVKRNRMRAGMLVGVALGVLFAAYLFSAVWQVDVSGNETVTAAQLLEVAREEGLYRGAPKRAVDPVRVRRALAKRFPQINWCAVNMRGARSEIQIREVTPGVKVFDESGAFDVIAAKDGQIERIEAYRGRALVRAPDTVTKGQTIISGAYETTDGRTYTVHAAGSCTALTNARIVFDARSLRVDAVRDLKRRPSFYLFGCRFPPVSEEGREDRTFCEKDVCGPDHILPLGVVTVSEWATGSANPDDRSRMLLAMQQACDAYRSRIAGAQLVGSEWSWADGRVTVSLRLREEIAVETPIRNETE